MGKTILIFISLIIITIAVNFIYNAKEIKNKSFNKNEGNSTIKVIKIIGIVLAWMGFALLYIVKI